MSPTVLTRLLADGQPDVQGLQDLEQGLDARIAVAGKGAIERLPSQSAGLGDGGHAFGPRHVAEGLGEVPGVMFLQGGVEVLDQRLVGVEEIHHIEFLEFDRAHLNLLRHLLGLPYISPLAGLVSATEQDDDRLLANGVVDAVALADIDSKLADAAANRSVVAKVAVLNALQTGKDRRSSTEVTQSNEPLLEDLRVDELHTRIVSHKGQRVKWEVER